MRHIIPALLALGIVASLPYIAHAATVFATPSTIEATLKAAPCGSTVILVGSQPFGPSRGLSGRVCATPIIVSAGTVSVGAVYYKGTTGLDWRGGVLAGFRGDGVSNVTLTGAAVLARAGGPTSGVSINTGKNVVLQGLRLDGFATGVSFNRVDGFTVSGSSFTGMGSDGFQGAAVWRGTITGNDFRNFAPYVAGVHRDGIQLRSLAGVAPSSDITVSLNTLSLQMAQGITFTDHGEGGGDRIQVLDNVIQAGQPSGIGMTAVRFANVQRNAVTTFPGSPYQSRFVLATSASHCSNTAAGYGGKRALADQPC